MKPHVGDKFRWANGTVWVVLDPESKLISLEDGTRKAPIHEMWGSWEDMESTGRLKFLVDPFVCFVRQTREEANK